MGKQLSIKLNVNQMTGLDDNITVLQGSSKCVENVVITESIDSSKDGDGNASCNTKASGNCAFEDSKFGLNFTNSSGVQVGSVSFYEVNSTHWNLSYVTNALNGYLISVDGGIHTSDKDQYTLTIKKAPYAPYLFGGDVDTSASITDSPSAVVFNNKLYCFHQGHDNDGQIWYDAFNGNTWAGDTRIQDPTGSYPAMTASPSAIVSNNRLYCFHQGHSNDGQIWYDIFDGTAWQGDTRIHDSTDSYPAMSKSPSAVVFNNMLYCFHQGHSNDGQLWYDIHTEIEGIWVWLGDQRVQNPSGSYPSMSESPSAVVFNNKIYCFYQGHGYDGQLWYDVYDGSSWAGDIQVPNTSMSASPSAIVFNNMLYCFHQGHSNDGQLWYNVFDGSSWAGDKQVPNTAMSASPSAMIFNDILYIFYQSYGNGGVLWYNTMYANPNPNPNDLPSGRTEESTAGKGCLPFARFFYRLLVRIKKWWASRR